MGSCLGLHVGVELGLVVGQVVVELGRVVDGSGSSSGR